MTLDTCLILIVLAVVLTLLQWRRCSRVLWGLAIILLLGVGCGPVPAGLLTGLQSDYVVRPSIAWAPRNVIVLLTADVVRVSGSKRIEPGVFANGRLATTWVLYRACKHSGNDCKVLVSGGDAMHTGISEAAVYSAYLQQLGVAGADLMLEPRSMNTWQNAQFSAPLLKAYGPQRTVLVTSALHLRRARLCFTHFGVVALPVRADWMAVRWSWWPRSWNFVAADQALHEYAGIAGYRIFIALGWNAPVI